MFGTWLANFDLPTKLGFLALQLIAAGLYVRSME
jgi:hypothetical protein